MLLDHGVTVIDDALNLAVEKLRLKGLTEQDAYVALLVRLGSIVPEEVREIADILFHDPDLLSAMKVGAKPEAVTADAG
jgi:hypothetical protein